MTGGSLTFGFPVGNGFTRMFTNYSYEKVRVTEVNTAFTDPLVLQRYPAHTPELEGIVVRLDVAPSA